MKKLAIIAAILGSFLVIAEANAVIVDGYYKKNGTYVAPHYRSSPNDNPYDNYRQP